VKVAHGDLIVDTNDSTGQTRIFWQKQVIFGTISPALYYAEEWLSEANASITFEKVERVDLENFEARTDFHFGRCTRVDKRYRVQAGAEVFTCFIRIHIFLERALLYVNVDIEGNNPKSDTLGGFVDVGVLSNVEVYRFFHGAPGNTPLEDQPNKGNNGIPYFSPQQDAWQYPCLTTRLVNNDRIPISYLLGKVGGNVVACLGINRYGQRGILRASNLGEIPHGLKFVSGNYLPAQKYEHLSGGLIAFGDDPYAVTERIFRTDMEILKRTHVLRVTKEYPEIFEYLGFCTRNTFHTDMDEAGIKDLAANNFTKETGSDRFKYLIIDDGWQSVNGMDVQRGPPPPPSECKTKRGLRALSANYNFPGGIRSVVNLLKKQYGLRWVGVWLAASGYWDGVEPNSPLGQKYPIVMNNGVGFPDPYQLRGYYFWADYLRVIRSWGVDLLKIDNQCSLGSIVAGKYAIGEHICNIYTMLQGAAYSSNMAVLNSMCMASDCKVYWTKSNIARVSNNFVPDNFASIKTQIKQCVFNPIYYALFTWPDQDMLQTYGTIVPLVLLHAVSGGPIYFADGMRETKAEVINKLCFPDGRLARLDAPALNSPDCLFKDTDADTPAKMWNFHDLVGWSRTYYVFVINNTQDMENLPTNVGMADIPAAQPREDVYIIYDRETGKYSVMDANSNEYFNLDNFCARYCMFAPFLQGIAILGCDEVYNGTKAIAAVELVGDRTLFLEVAYGSTLRFYVPRIADTSSIRAETLDGKTIPIQLEDNFVLIPNAPKGRILLHY